MNPNDLILLLSGPADGLQQETGHQHTPTQEHATTCFQNPVMMLGDWRQPQAAVHQAIIPPRYCFGANDIFCPKLHPQAKIEHIEHIN